MESSTAATIKRRVARARAGTFLRVADLATHHHHRHAVEHALSRLAASDAPLVRARKGLYYRGLSSRFGKIRPRPMDVALEVTRGTGAGPAGWSALRALGLTTQVPSVDEVAVVGAAPTGIDGVRFHVRRNPDRLHLTFDEIAALEAIRAWPTRGESGSEPLEDAVRALVADGRIRPERLVKAGRREPPGVRASLGQLFAAAA